MSRSTEAFLDRATSAKVGEDGIDVSFDTKGRRVAHIYRCCHVLVGGGFATLDDGIGFTARTLGSSD